MTITASLLNPAFTPLATADVHSTFGLAPRDGVAQTVADNTPALAWGIRGSFYRYVAGATHILDGAKKGPGDYFLWPYQSTKAEGARLAQPVRRHRQLHEILRCEQRARTRQMRP